MSIDSRRVGPPAEYALAVRPPGFESDVVRQTLNDNGNPQVAFWRAAQ